MKWAVFGAGAQGRLTAEGVALAHPGAEVVRLDDRAPDAFPRSWLLAREAIAEWRVLVAIGRNDVRLRIASELQSAGARFGVLVFPTAFVSPSASLGPGAVVFPGAVVNGGAAVGAHAIINTRAVVEHDATIEDGVSLSPGAVSGGRVIVRRGAFVGVGAVLCPRVEVGEGAIIGAGAVVTRNVPPGVVAYGNPARVVRPVDVARDWKRLL